MLAAPATGCASRAPARTLTILDDLSGWGSVGLLPAGAPAPLYVPPGADMTYPPPAPTAWGFSNVRGLRFTAAGTKTLTKAYGGPLDFAGANVIIPLRTTDPRSVAGSWQSLWRITLSSDGGQNTQAIYAVQASSADYPVNQPGRWFPVELPTTNLIPAGQSFASVSRFGIPTGKIGPDFSAINWVQVQATSKAANGHGDPPAWDLYIGGLGRIERSRTPVYTFYCDRFHADNYTYLAAVLERSLPQYGGDGHYRGWKMTFRGDPNDFDAGPTLMTTAMAQELQHRKGHRFGIYSGDFGPRKDWTDPDTGTVVPAVFASGENNMGGNPAHAYPTPWDLLTDPSIDTVIDGLQGSKDRLLALGIATQSDLACGQERKLYGDAYQTVIEGMFAYSDMPNASDHPVWWPPLDPHHVPTRMHLAVPDEANNQAALDAWLDRGVDENQWLRGLLHNVDPDTSVGAAYVMTPTQLERHCQQIEKPRPGLPDGIPVRSHDDVHHGRVPL